MISNRLRILALVAGILLIRESVGVSPIEPGEGRRLQHSSPILKTVSLDDRSNCGTNDTAPNDRVITAQRVENLITEMKKNNFQAYIVPSTDEHQSEYVSESDLRRQYISGFSGSAGTALVLSNGTRALWTDGRYFLQADDQLDCDWLLMKSKQEGVPTLEEYLGKALKTGEVVGSDAKLLGYGYWLELNTSLAKSGIVLEPSKENLVDIVWDADTGADSKRPPPSNASVFIHEQEFAGASVSEKLGEVRSAMMQDSAHFLVVSALDEVAWLFNIRGGDVLYNPVVRSYALISNESAILYVDENKINDGVKKHLDDSDILVRPYSEFFTELEALNTGPNDSQILLPDDSLSSGCSYEIYKTVSEKKRLSATSPVLLLKAEKNTVELEKMKEAHVYDAVALCDFLAHLEQKVVSGEKISEVGAQEDLINYRKSQPNFIELSFGSISGYGPHGAVIHYRATTLTDSEIGTDSLYLLDSGGQYSGGTTDVTRTMHFGTPTEEMVDMYTRVLMGTIDFGSVVFPQGKKKSQIDILARRALFSKGRDYNHGTSHGIGMCLNVHEPVTDEMKLGNVMSDEPGYYKDGHWGIRIENQIFVKDVTETEFDGSFYTFEHMTLVPFEPKLINVEILTDEQIEWLNNYYSEIREKIGPIMMNQNRSVGYNWLMAKTEAINVTEALSTTTEAISTTEGSSGTILASLTVTMISVLVTLCSSLLQ